MNASNGYKASEQRRDEEIMATNNSSIVSKRSVERLYFQHEPHFFRYFVRKPQRRAPVINRGYWLRMKAIDHVVRKFLEEPSEKRKIVINLGCGYDPLPWQCLVRYPEASKNVTFVDIDYPSLLEKKKGTVLATPELRSMLTNLASVQENGVLLKSDQYFQVGCDLREIPMLSKILASLFNFKDFIVLFTAEVSITYMRLPHADKLIQFAGTFPNARFCLLEQILPDGPNHPFAKTMLSHFNKLQTSLKSVELYPTVISQESRFRERGWSTTKACNLWELWSSEDFLTSEQRMSLDDVEPFDEWEEFILFGEHYFLLVASNDSKANELLLKADLVIPFNPASRLVYVENPKNQGCRRFAATLPLDVNVPQPKAVANHAGMGLNMRLSCVDVFSPVEVSIENPSRGPSPRMCHAITDLGDVAMISGGRTSPDNALSDCWLYYKKDARFERVEDLPDGRFRHAAVAIGREVLVIGGKGDSRNLAETCLIWSKQRGWRKIAALQPMATGAINENLCHVHVPQATYGALMVSFMSRAGVLVGGISKDGTICQDLWHWRVEVDDAEEHISISFQRACHKLSGRSCLARFGACAVTTPSNRVYIIGGVGAELLTEDTEITEICFEASATELSPAACPFTLDRGVPRPLLIGMSVALVNEGILIMGGGATCFSFGTYLNRGCYTLINTEDPFFSSNDGVWKPWRFAETITKRPEVLADKAPLNVTNNMPLLRNSTGANISRTKIAGTQDFERVMRDARPVILEGLDIGSCTSLWTPEYMKDRIGHDHQIIVHEATMKKMDFQAKNFAYNQWPFGKFIDAAERGKKLYLRALSAENPSTIPADLARDFPSISHDFRLPPELRFVRENAHSSPLRIAGDVTMWLHYDVMANVLCQIRGIKRVLLFPPGDIQYLQFAPGASSSSIDLISRPMQVPGTRPHEGILHPGEVLFLPALWLHTTAPAKTAGLSVSVNVFFRNLQSGYAAGRDVYGNRDLAAYEKGRRDVAKIAKSFDKIPADMREFYLIRLAEELRAKATSGL